MVIVVDSISFQLPITQLPISGRALRPLRHRRRDEELVLDVDVVLTRSDQVEHRLVNAAICALDARGPVARAAYHSDVAEEGAREYVARYCVLANKAIQCEFGCLGMAKWAEEGSESTPLPLDVIPALNELK